MGRVHTVCCLMPLEHIGSFQAQKKFQMKHREQRNKFDKSMHGNPTFTFIQYHSILFHKFTFVVIFQAGESPLEKCSVFASEGFGHVGEAARQ